MRGVNAARTAAAAAPAPALSERNPLDMSTLPDLTINTHHKILHEIADELFEFGAPAWRRQRDAAHVGVDRFHPAAGDGLRDILNASHTLEAILATHHGE